MPSFEDILKDINTGTQALGTVLPTISATGIGSLQSISSIVAAAGATVASTAKDQSIAAESIAATQTALAVIPLLFALFHKNAQSKAGQ